MKRQHLLPIIKVDANRLYALVQPIRISFAECGIITSLPIIANEDPLGIVLDVQPEGSYIWDGAQMTPYHKRFISRGSQAS